MRAHSSPSYAVYSLRLVSLAYRTTRRAIINSLSKYNSPHQQNSTLAPYLNCSNAISDFDSGEEQAMKWVNHTDYTGRIIKRLQPFINVTLTSIDIVSMQELCAYEASREKMSRGMP
jgi:hypothetical protein